jgi:hypothetical protein
MGAAVVLAAGCAESTAQQRAPASGAQAVESEQSTVDPSAVSQEKLDELNQFFYRKMGPLQYRCYNDEVERTHKKYEGNLSLSLIVRPGGRATDVKVIGSTLNSPEIERCVVDEIKQWGWPDVPGPAPYTGSINFKPAW